MLLHRRLLTCVTGAALLALAGPTVVASAASTPQEIATPQGITLEKDKSYVMAVGAGKLPNLSETLIRDLTFQAQDTGESLANLTLQMQQQEAFSSVVSQIETRFPKEYAGSTSEAGNGYFGTISFVGQVPSQAQSLLTTLPYKVRIEQDAKHSMIDLQKTVDAVTAAWADNEEVDQYIAYVDTPTHSVVVDYRLDPGADKRALVKEASAQAATVVNSQQNISGVPVRFTENPEMSGAPQVLTGGTALGFKGKTGAKALECTAGFAVRKYGGTGLLSAEHCGDEMTYEGNPNILARAENMSRSYGDVQWQGSSEPARARFVSSRSGTTLYTSAVTSVQPSLSDGMAVNLYGTTGGRRVANIYTVYSTVRYPDGRTYGAMVLNRPKNSPGLYAQFGDSGGPYYNGTVAYGIHSGTTRLSNGRPVEAWTPAFRLQQRAGTIILTS